MNDRADRAVAKGLEKRAKVRPRALSKAERRQLAEMEELEELTRRKQQRLMKTSQQVAWSAITVVLVVALSLCLIKLLSG